jgi:hypothetical protein
MKPEIKQDRKQKILLGLELAYKKMLEFKKQKQTPIVIMRDGKIVKVQP